MLITQRYLLNQKHHRNTRRFKRLPRLPLRVHNCGSKPKKKRKTGRLKPSLLQAIKRFLQSTRCAKENIMLNNLLDNRLAVRRPMREPPFISLRC